MATLLVQNERIKKIMAFSAGPKWGFSDNLTIVCFFKSNLGCRKCEYESYFTQIGVNNIKIYADRLTDIHPDSAYMEEVVAVFATPPNSYSAVLDPIDLVLYLWVFCYILISAAFLILMANRFSFILL